MRHEPSAFDLWVKRDLTRRFADTLRDPIPEDLLLLLGERD